MGIPGLLNACQEKMRFIKAAYLQGRHVHVDGLNFVGSLVRDVNPTKTTGVLEEVENNLKRNLEMLMHYEPKSLTFYFDAYHPPGKKVIRAGRRRRNLKELNTHRQVCHMSVLAVKFLLANNVRVVYTGLEAEDEIIKGIDEKLVRFSQDQHLVFSSDSDLFTFRVKRASQIEIVPIARNKMRKAGVNSINMGAIHKAGIVSANLMRDVPHELSGRSTVATRPMSSVLDMVNQGKVHCKFSRNPPLIYAPDGSNPHELGIDIRRAAYGLILKKWFNGLDSLVSEKVQENSDIKRWWVDPLKGEELEAAKSVLVNQSTADIVANQFEYAPAHFNIQLSEVEAVRTYLRDLCLGSTIVKSQELSARTHSLFPLLKSVLCSVLVWEEALGGPLAHDNLLWRITPFEFDAYL